MGRVKYNIDPTLFKTKSDYVLSKELNIPRSTLQSIRRRKRITAFIKPLSTIQKIKIIKNYLENTKFTTIKTLYKSCGFTKINGVWITLIVLNQLISEYDIHVYNKSGVLKKKLKTPRKKRCDHKEWQEV